MELIKSIMTNNPCYKAGKTIEVKGLILHSIGTPQPDAMKIIKYWNSGTFSEACVHGFVDGNTGKCYQTLPWNYRGWHAGSPANNSYIGVEMCEPSVIEYKPNSAEFTCSNVAKAKEVVKRTYESAVELFAYLCEQFKLDPLKDGVILSHREGSARGIATNHADPEHLWIGLDMGYTMDTFRKAVKNKMNKKGLQASDLKNLSEADTIEKVGSLFTADQKKSGILACVSLAQFILESGYGKTELAQNANNCFGMKKELSGNTWSGSTWDGKSIYTKKTNEEYTAGQITTITADFRKYPNIEDSIADHSAYLLGAKKGSSFRYEGLKGCSDYKKAITIIKNGGYATDSKYIEKICNIIERWNLTRFNYTNKIYRVQVGAFEIKENAEAMKQRMIDLGFKDAFISESFS